jgi:hypothetical protein
VYEWEALLYTFHHYPGAPILLFGFLCSFAISFSIGANDSANSWGTSVGKKHSERPKGIKEGQRKVASELLILTLKKQALLCSCPLADTDRTIIWGSSYTKLLTASLLL